MAKRIKSVKATRAEIGSFEKEQTTPFFLYQVKEYNEAGLVTHETEYKPNGLKEMEITYEFDNQMRMAGKQTYYPLEETLEKLVYIFDSEGRKVKEENYFGDDIFETLLYTYDSHGNITGQVRGDDEGMELEKQVSEFDSSNRLVKQTNYTNGEMDRIIDFEYNETGLCTREVHTYPEKESVETIEYSYNELGKRTTAITKDDEGYEIGYLEVEYDEKMNPVKYISETSGFHNSKTINQIIYDEEGRAIDNEYFDMLNNFLMSKERIEYDENGNIAAQEIFETNPMAGLKKTHYRLKLEYDFFGE
jgi:hypothetical protein